MDSYERFLQEILTRGSYKKISAKGILSFCGPPKDNLNSER